MLNTFSVFGIIRCWVGTYVAMRFKHKYDIKREKYASCMKGTPTIGRIFFSDENMKYNIFIVAIKYTHETHSILIGCHRYTHATKFCTQPNSLLNSQPHLRHTIILDELCNLYFFYFPNVQKSVLALHYRSR